MDVSGLLTSLGINTGLCLVLFTMYALLRRQPSMERVYFRLGLDHLRSVGRDLKFVPKWISEAWEASDEKILDSGGLDAVAFLRFITFSGKIFSFAAVVSLLFVLPLNYFGEEMLDQHIPSIQLDLFTIGNVREGSKWLWAHCIGLYIISGSACRLLYDEYKNMAKMRLDHINGSSLKPSYFTVLVRGIPSSPEVERSVLVRNFFKNYHGYLSHQMVDRSGTVQKLMNDESKMIKTTSTEQFGTCLKSRGLCGRSTYSFEVLSREPESVTSRNVITDQDFRDEECAAALVFFKTRHAALLASEVLQSADPMSWVTDLAPEPHDVYWKSLSIPYGQLWFRRIATVLASFVVMILFGFLVSIVQGLLLLEQLEKRFPFLSEILKSKFVVNLITGYLPSLVLMLFLLAVPPVLMRVSTFEGPISRSARKTSACGKVFCFLIWNVFFGNVLSANIIQQLFIVSNPGNMTQKLAEAVPRQATFFMTYVLTSGWGSLASEIMRPFTLICHIFNKYILRKEDEPSTDTLSFPYHTEIPKVLLFGFLGFTYSLMAPLILPFLLVFFFLASLVYRNQILNVYVKRYDSGGQFWPIMHKSTISMLVLTQVIAIGVFGLKRSTVAAAFTVPLIIFTLLFNEYCRQRFHPVFKDNAAQVLIKMDQIDEKCGSMKVMHKQLPSAYCQFESNSNDFRKSVPLNPCNDGDHASIRVLEDWNPGLVHPTLVKAFSI